MRPLRSAEARRLMAGQLANLVPGLVAATGLAIFSTWMSSVLGTFVLGYDKSPVSSVMIAVIAGLAIGNVIRLPALLFPGVKFAVQKLLRLGIVLLGIRLSLLDVLSLGAVGIPVVVGCIAAGLCVTAFMAHRMSVPKRLGTLIGVGTSICGVSAILATAPAIEAQDEEVAYAIAVVTTFGLFATIVYPYLARGLFSGDPVRVGLFLGTAIHDTSQVAGAAMLYAQVYESSRALDIALLTKLIRNVLMVGVIPIATLLHARRAGEVDVQQGRRRRRVLPLFVVAFLCVSVLRSVGEVTLARSGRALMLLDRPAWGSVVTGVEQLAGFLLVVALAGVGLTTRFHRMLRIGARPFIVGLVASLIVGGVSYAIILLLWSMGLIEGMRVG